MKLVGIVGSTSELSYNRILLEFIKKRFNHLFDLDLIEIKDLAIFNQSDNQTNSAEIQDINRRILAADGVIISTAEHNHTIPAGLKSLLEWLSFKIHPLENKPVMIVGASYFRQGSSRAQLHLRQILDAPGVNAIVMPGNEFLLGDVKNAFDQEGNLKDQGTVDFLTVCLNKFMRFIQVVSVLEEPEKTVVSEEDLYANNPIETTVQGVDMYADDWLEQAAEKVGAVEGDTYVKLNRGLLTVKQLNYFLASLPMELTYVDSNNQFLYYNLTKPSEEMLASRTPAQVGNPLGRSHPNKVHENVKYLIKELRLGTMDAFHVNVATHGSDKYVVHNYQAIRDEKGNYVGMNEYIHDLKPIIDWYLRETGQKLVKDVDAVASASKKEEKVDAVASATAQTDTSESEVIEKVDAVSSATVNN